MILLSCFHYAVNKQKSNIHYLVDEVLLVQNDVGNYFKEIAEWQALRENELNAYAYDSIEIY